jgi:endonuclease/exonuclease/phosphatase family metal-dependent hydrolase
MRRLIVLAAFALTLFSAHVQAADPHLGDVTVMTRNMYLGADIAGLLSVQDFEGLIAAVTATVATIEASDPAARIAAIADEIARQQPDLVGLQEAIILRTGPFTFPQTPATTVAFDFVDLLIQALAARGLSYSVVASVDNFEAQVPRLTAGGLQDVRLTDRDVILARAGVAVSNIQAENYTINLEVPNPLFAGGVIAVLRGWVAVDVAVESGTFRFVNSHLETFSAQVQVAQAMELLAGPLDTTLPVVLVCDCNSDASGQGPDSTPTYELLVASGLTDAWSARHPGARGFTCCQDADLRNTRSLLYERIDFVFVRGAVDVEKAQLVGARPADRTPKPGRLWPSDHAGVVADLQVE